MNSFFRKPTNSIVKCLSSNFLNPVTSPKEDESNIEVPKPKEPPVTIKEEPADTSDDLEVVEEPESFDHIESMDLLAELMNKEGTENLHYMKSLSDAA